MWKPSKPSPDFPLFPHGNGQWAKKIDAKLRYFGSWDDPEGALQRYLAQANGATPKKVSGKAKPDKPHKPRPDYPLYPHASGKWAKKIRGKTYYFGSWDDPDGALERYLALKDGLLAGRTPSSGDGLTARDLVNRFLTTKRRLVDSGELEKRTWFDYLKTAERVLSFFGHNRLVESLQPEDFQRLREDLSGSRSPTTLSNEIGRVRVLFKYAYDHCLIGRPVRYGQGFKKPSRKTLRRERAKRPPRMFQAHELRQAIDAAGVQLRAMILLGINCGLGNNDCMLLLISALDLDREWLTYPRPKTGVTRECPLWPETVQALQEALAARPQVKSPEHQDRVFITRYGNPWQPKTDTDNPVSKEMAKLLQQTGLKRPGLSFYALRHTFQTIGQQTLDKDAVRYIMGHVEDASDMSAVYNEQRPIDERLRKVTDHVRDWLRNTPSPLQASVESDGAAQGVEPIGSE
jgi:integrase